MAMMSITRALLAKIKSTPLPSCRTYHGWKTFASLNPCLWCRHPTSSRGLFLLLRGSPCCWFCTLRLQSDLFIQGHLVSWRGSWAIVPLCMGHMQPWKQSCSFHRAPLCLFSLLSHCNVQNIVTISFSLHGCQSHLLLSLRPLTLETKRRLAQPFSGVSLLGPLLSPFANHRDFRSSSLENSMHHKSFRG
jgi:hypothetical protein